MSCAGDDFDAAMDLIAEELPKLHALNPQHELLTFMGDGAQSDEKWEQFQTRFGKPGLTPEKRASTPAQAYCFTQYYIALRTAVQELTPVR